MIYLPEVCRQPRTVDRIFERAGCGVGCWEIGFPSTWFHELRPTPSHVFKCPGEVNDKLRTDFTCIWELNWKIVCWNVRNQSCSHSYCFILAMAKEKDSILLGCSSSIKWLLTYLVEIKNGILLYVSNEPTGLWRKSFLCNSSNFGFYSFSGPTKNIQNYHNIYKLWFRNLSNWIRSWIIRTPRVVFHSTELDLALTFQTA